MTQSYNDTQKKNVKKQILIQHDASIDIATGRHRRELNWKNKEMLWSDLLNKLSATHRTAETYAEYITAKKPRQDEIKDIGGFVGGYLDKGRRKKGNLVHRQLLTLDLDFAKPEMWEDFQLLYSNAACIYSTHKHSPESPRLRLIMPLSREVMADEYTAIARKIAGNIGIEQFDSTSYQPERLMYWPSTPKDGEYIFEYQDGEFLNADAVLASYHNWKDSSEWPVSEKEKAIPQRAIKKQGDPLEKTGMIGAFCRTYSISDAIDNFLSDVYESTEDKNRFTYKEGSTAAGLVVYEDKFAFSHHGTDPTSGKLCNAFDLVRLHKFGMKDEDSKPDTPIQKLPSFIAMEEFVTTIREVRKNIDSEKLTEAQNDFNEGPEVNEDWKADLDIDRKGNWLSTRKNVILILENDSGLKEKIILDSFYNRIVVKGNLPWRKKTEGTKFWTDSDDAELRIYLENKYGISSASVIDDCLLAHTQRNQVHPVREYLKSLKWDCKNRIENLLIDYLGAADNDYTKAVTRKMLTAAVARVYEPGCKFDYVLVLVGSQGQKKSMLLNKLGRQWFSDSFTTVQGKEAIEQIQGVWIVEMGELAGLKKAEVESIKHYISKREDRYRVAYGRRVENFPRQCVFFATSNNKDFLRDTTGNRRFWPVDTYHSDPVKDVFKDLSEYEINQLWAEAVELHKQKEPLYLTAELEEIAYTVQNDHCEEDPRTGQIENYLDKLLPKNWDELDIYQRREWLRDDDELQQAGVIQRKKVCVAEIWCEALGGNQRDLKAFEAKPIHAIMRNMKGWQEHKSKLSFKGPYGTSKAYCREKTVTAVSAAKSKKLTAVTAEKTAEKMQSRQ